MNKLMVSVAAAAALCVAPAAVALDRVWPSYSVSITAAPSVQNPPSDSGSSGTSGSDGSSGSSGSYGNNGNDGTNGNNSPGQGWWGGQQGSTGQSAPTISGTKVASAPGVVMVDTVMPGGEGAGTGIVLRSGGVILTNYHVVEGSTSIRVTDSNGETHTATVVGYDADHDIAVIKLTDGANLTTATLDTATAAVGDKVTAIGQGGGVGSLYTTSGTITALDQQITAREDSTSGTSETLTGLIETDAQIVPGYSGGPLLDAQGEVVGIDAAASSSTPITGYAIPISTAVSIADQIESGNESGTVHIGPRAAIGVEIYSGAGQHAGSNGGAQVMSVMSGSAAQSAGITAGSTITGLAGTTIGSASELTTVLEKDNPGDKVSVTWVDATGMSRTAIVTLGIATTN